MAKSNGTRAKTLTLDERAIALLRDELTPTHKSHGRVVSELIYLEVARREERQRWAQEHDEVRSNMGALADET